jgi:PKD repeat protein
VDGVPQDFGTLSARTVATNADGVATLTFTSPPNNPAFSGTCRNLPGTCVDIVATPIGSSFETALPQSVQIRLVPPGVILPPASTPTASFTVSPNPVLANVPAIFDASASQPGTGATQIASYSWDFGDGSSGSGLVLQHTFTSSGVFNVTLTTTSLAHGTTNSTTRPIVIAAPALPVANFTTGPCAVVVASCFRFTDASTVGAGATITGHLIDFGDNTNASALPAERTYAAAGTYNVRLTVTDSLGRTATTTRPLVVP